MGAVLHRIDDPRDALQKARRYELLQFAKAHSVTDIVPGMPANLMRRILRERGLTHINVPPRPLGVVGGNATPQDAPATQVNADDDLMRQYTMQKSVDDMTIGELRSEAKRRGIKQKIGESRDSLKAKLNGKQDAA